MSGESGYYSTSGERASSEMDDDDIDEDPGYIKAKQMKKNPEEKQETKDKKHGASNKGKGKSPNEGKCSSKGKSSAGGDSLKEGTPSTRFVLCQVDKIK